MRSSPFWWVLIFFMILLDIYVFQVVKMLAQTAGPRLKITIYSIYWGISIIALLTLIFLPFINSNFNSLPKAIKTSLFAIIVGLFFAKLIASVFFLVDDVRRGVQWIAGKIFFSGTEGEEMQEAGRSISRSAFLSWTGTIVGTGLFGTLLYGFNNKYRYQLKKVKLSLANLPASFKGMRIVQISDVHSGSLNNREAVQKGINKILETKPDLILFTGDLVNYKSDEMEPFMDVFNQLKAPMGVYSILGNHDYGDYVEWESEDAKVQNLQNLVKVHSDLGWRLLMNEHVRIERGNEAIALIGIENWSALDRFPKYGSLQKAHEGTGDYPFKILMSHDPSHWDAEVKTKYKDIDLMLSGHTHGMQFGVEVPGFRWSPVQYVYRQWAGLYKHENQHLYVNRGFGFIGYPGRVGILPEITVIELM